MSARCLIALVLLAACSKKKDEPAPPVPPAAPPAEAAKQAPPAPADTVAANRLDYDLPMVGDHKGGFDASFALLHLGREDSGQGDLVVFGPDVKPGDKGGATEWKDLCDTRLNAFPYAGVHGFRIMLSNVKTLPTPPAKLEANNITFDLQGDGWALAYKDVQAHPFSADVQLVKSDGKEADVDVRIVEPGKDGSLHGRIHAKVCPSAQ